MCPVHKRFFLVILLLLLSFVCLFVLFSFVVLSTNLASGRELERKERISHPHPHPFSLAVNNILFSYALSLKKRSRENRLSLPQNHSA